MIKDRKITTFAKDVRALSDTPNDNGMTSAQLKAIFMGAVDEETKTSINGIIDDLASNIGSGEIGSLAIPNLGQSVDSTVYAQLVIAAAMILDRYTKTQIDGFRLTDADKYIANVTLNANKDLVVTWGDGDIQTIALDLEKIPASFSFDATGTKLVITNQDGSKYETDVTSLINLYTFNDSSTIDFVESGYNISATIKAGSITDAMLSSALITQLQGYVTSADADASSANSSKLASAISETNAKAAETSAATSEANAFSFRNAAATSETNAKTSETNAKTSETNSKTSETNALESEDHSRTFAISAQSSSNSATASSNSATASKIEAQSYAIGGTNSRTGEDTDNAKYYYQQAHDIAEGVGSGILTGYVKGESDFDVAATDTVNEAFGKVEKKLDGKMNVSYTTVENIGDVYKTEGVLGLNDEAFLGSVSMEDKATSGQTYSDHVSFGCVQTDIGEAIMGGLTSDYGKDGVGKLSDVRVQAGTVALYSFSYPTATPPAEPTINQKIEITPDKTTIAGTLSITGTTTFDKAPIVPTPVANTEAVNKTYVDTADALLVKKDGTTAMNYLTVGTRAGTVGENSVSEGELAIASGIASHAEGDGSVALSNYSHAEGEYTFVACGEVYKITAYDSTAKTITLDSNPFSVGDVVQVARSYQSALLNVPITAVSGNTITLNTTESINSMWLYIVLFNPYDGSAHAEGFNTFALGDVSHAEGYQTTASGYNSHAEGNTCTASGNNSHAQNHGTIAQGKGQTAIGSYNIAQGTGTSYATTDYAIILGNGKNSSSRSNALTVTWEGNMELAKGLKVGDNIDANSKKIINLANPTENSDGANKEYVDDTAGTLANRPVQGKRIGHIYVSTDEVGGEKAYLWTGTQWLLIAAA